MLGLDAVVVCQPATAAGHDASAATSQPAIGSDAKRLAEIKAEVNGLRGEVLGRERLNLGDSLRIGELLNEAKLIVRRMRPKKLWKTWVVRNCSFADEYARRLTRLSEWAKLADNAQQLRDCESVTEALELAGIVRVADVLGDNQVKRLREQLGLDDEAIRRTAGECPTRLATGIEFAAEAVRISVPAASVHLGISAMFADPSNVAKLNAALAEGREIVIRMAGR